MVFQLILTVLAVAVFPWVFGPWSAWPYARSKELLESWAERSGVRIIEFDLGPFAANPFRPRYWPNQVICRVSVQDKGGKRTGWVRFGSWMPALLPDFDEVLWDDAACKLGPVKSSPSPVDDVMADAWLDG
jgi:hypothetical protein